MHPVFDEFCRAAALQPHVFRRMQRQVRTEIQPLLDERETLLVEVASLREANADLQRQIETLMATSVKRGPGRPRKVQPDDVAVGA